MNMTNHHLPEQYNTIIIYTKQKVFNKMDMKRILYIKPKRTPTCLYIIIIIYCFRGIDELGKKLFIFSEIYVK